MDQSFASRVKGTVGGLDGCVVNLLYTSLIIIVLVLQPSGIIVCSKESVAWYKLYLSFYLTLVRCFFFKIWALSKLPGYSPCNWQFVALYYFNFSRHLIKLLPKDRSKVGKIGKILIFELYLQTDPTRRKKFFIQIITSISVLLLGVPLTLADLAGAKDQGPRLILGHSEARRVEKYSQTSLIRTPKGQNQVSALQRCPYYRGRECMIFGISGTKRTVRNREVSVRRG